MNSIKIKELISVYEHKNFRGAETESIVNFYNGAVISSRQTKSEVLPNNMGREILSDTDITLPIHQFILSQLKVKKHFIQMEAWNQLQPAI